MVCPGLGEAQKRQAWWDPQQQRARCRRPVTQSVEGGPGASERLGAGPGASILIWKVLAFLLTEDSFPRVPASSSLWCVCVCVCVCVCLFAYAWAPLSPEVLGFQEVSVDPSCRIWKPEKARPAEAVVRCVLQPETALLRPRSLPVPMPQIPLLK